VRFLLFCFRFKSQQLFLAGIDSALSGIEEPGTQEVGLVNYSPQLAHNSLFGLAALLRLKPLISIFLRLSILETLPGAQSGDDTRLKF